MTAVLTRNPFDGEEVQSPIKPDGSRHRFEMIFEQGRSRAYADTTAELVEVLVGAGYVEMSPEERTAARVTYATGLLAPMQATALGTVDQSALTEDERRVLFQPRFEPVVVAEWSSKVPLVLLDVHYAPFSEIPAPVSAVEDVQNPSNIVWVCASEDYELLVSLHRVGVITLSESNDYLV